MSGSPNAGYWTGHICRDIRKLEIGPDTNVRTLECWRLDRATLEHPNAGDWTGHICRDLRMLEIGPDNVKISECWRMDWTYMSGYPNAGDLAGQC